MNCFLRKSISVFMVFFMLVHGLGLVVYADEQNAKYEILYENNFEMGDINFTVTGQISTEVYTGTYEDIISYKTSQKDCSRVIYHTWWEDYRSIFVY